MLEKQIWGRRSTDCPGHDCQDCPRLSVRSTCQDQGTGTDCPGDADWSGAWLADCSVSALQLVCSSDCLRCCPRPPDHPRDCHCSVEPPQAPSGSHLVSAAAPPVSSLLKPPLLTLTTLLMIQPASIMSKQIINRLTNLVYFTVLLFSSHLREVWRQPRFIEDFVWCGVVLLLLLIVEIVVEVPVKFPHLSWLCVSVIYDWSE